MKYLALGVLLASFTCTTHADSPNETPAHLYRVGIGNEITAPGEVYAGDALYALFEKQNEKWKILNVSFSPPKVTNAPVQEVLVFSNDFTIVEPYFLPYIDWLGAKYNHKWSSSDRGIYSCARVYSREDRPLYNPCESSLTSIDNAVASAALQTLAGVMSMGLTVAGGATGWDYRVDPDKVKKLVTESGAIDEVRQKQIVLYAEKKLNDYRMSYQAATSAQSLTAAKISPKRRGAAV